MGCCSLRVEHVKECEQPNMLHLNFLGKDSIEYDNTTEVIPEVMELIKKFMRKKKPTDNLFDMVVPSMLNDYFHTIMEGLSAKVLPHPNPNPDPNPNPIPNPNPHPYPFPRSSVRTTPRSRCAPSSPRPTRR